MQWTITVDQVNRFTGRWERRAEVFEGDGEAVEEEARFEALGCGWSCSPETFRRVYVGRSDEVASVSIAEGGWVVTATRLP